LNPSFRSIRCSITASLILVIATAAACMPAGERPRDGAKPAAAGSGPSKLLAEPPPTLVPPPRAPTPTPAPAATQPSPSPVGSPGIRPVISSIKPAPGTQIAPGDVTIGARVTGSSALVEVQAFVDGEALDLGLESPGPRVANLSFVRPLSVGTHEVRIQAKDEHGQTGGYRWQFVVAQGGAAPAPTSRTLPAPTLFPQAPLLVPRGTPVPSPGAR
jgi:hypothetical protein